MDKTGKIGRWCIWLFSGAFFLIWIYVGLKCAASLTQSKIICFAAFGLLLCAALGAALIRLAAAKVKNQKLFFRTASFLLLAVMIAGLLYAGMELRVEPAWDFGCVYQGAVEVVEDGAFSSDSNWYFTTYPNNLGACLFLIVIFKIFGGLFSSYITLGVVLNVVMMMLGLIFTYFIAERLFGYVKAFVTVCVLLCFLPFYMHSPIFYTDTFALPFVTGTFLLYLYRDRNPWILAAAGVVLGFGYKMKGSLGVIIIALLIHLWLHKESIVRRIKKSLMLLIPFIIIVAAVTEIPGQMSFFDDSEAEENEFPIWHWVAMGLTDKGGYSSYVYYTTVLAEGREGKIEADKAYISELMDEYGFDGLIEHLEEKIVFTWGDGVYFAPEKLKRNPLKDSWLHSYFLYTGTHYSKITYRYCNACQLLILLGMALSVFRNFLERGNIREIQAMQIAVFGLFLFLLIWETRSRYLMNFVPIFILMGVDGAEGMFTFARRRLPAVFKKRLPRQS